tara:strand:+ start:1470 stop:1610 length:141 start_codon:yes stop_codon:yes gene_type:complete
LKFISLNVQFLRKIKTSFLKKITDITNNKLLNPKKGGLNAQIYPKQ